jgi:flagellar basal body-associated protein FliL
MAHKENGTIVETEREATQAEKSPNTFVILILSLAALAVVAVVLFWYFGVFQSSLTRALP